MTSFVLELLFLLVCFLLSPFGAETAVPFPFRGVGISSHVSLDVAVVVVTAGTSLQRVQLQQAQRCSRRHAN